MPAIRELGDALRLTLESDGLTDGFNMDAVSDDFRDMEEAATVLQFLATYAGHKAAAMKFRTVRPIDIEAALASERCADAVYRKLPKWAQW